MVHNELVPTSTSSATLIGPYPESHSSTVGHSWVIFVGSPSVLSTILTLRRLHSASDPFLSEIQPFVLAWLSIEVAKHHFPPPLG